MMSLNCIAIDDEPLALSLIDRFIKKIPYLKLCSVFESAFDAINFLKTEKIDLIFLDINMPDLNGIQFLKTFHHPPLVIFTTAYEKYALESYELNAVDYLLKPFHFERFLKATDKALSIKLLKENLAEIPNESLQRNEPQHPKTDYLFVKSNQQMIKIEIKDILFVESVKDYVKIYLENHKFPILTISTLKSFYEILNKDEFIRVHRSFIVSITKIKSIQKSKISIQSFTIPIGELYSQEFYKKIGLHQN